MARSAFLAYACHVHIPQVFEDQFQRVLQQLPLCDRHCHRVHVFVKILPDQPRLDSALRGLATKSACLRLAAARSKHLPAALRSWLREAGLAIATAARAARAAQKPPSTLLEFPRLW